MGPGAYRRREISNEHHGPAGGGRPVGGSRDYSWVPVGAS